MPIILFLNFIFRVLHYHLQNVNIILYLQNLNIKGEEHRTHSTFSAGRKKVLESQKNRQTK